jgi:arsenite-transporting ATPase
MRSKEKSTFVFVMYPEYTPIIESWRASEELKSQVGIETVLVAVNYLLPQDYGKNRFFNNRRKQQEKYLIEIKQRFKTPMLTVPLLEHEPKGLGKLRELGRMIFVS